MKTKLPIIGEVKTGKDAEIIEPVVKVIDRKSEKDILGGFLDFGKASLSDEKTVSKKLLQANAGWVYINNDVIAEEVSKVEFRLFRVNLKAGEIVYDPVLEHPLLDLMDKPNDFTNKTEFIYTTQSHKKLTGDAFWLLDKSMNGVNSITILQPDKVTLDLGDPRNGEEIIKAYIYKDTIDGKVVKITYYPDEILHFKKPNPSNAFRGLGTVEAMAETIDLDNLTTATTKNFFKNGAITNFVLTTQNKVTDEQLKRLKAELRAASAGVANAYKTMILGGGLEPKDISYSNKELEFLSQLEWYRDKIMVGFNNTKASIGIVDDVNRASHESSMLEWKRTTVEPDIQSIVNTVNEYLVPLFDDRLVLGYEEIIPEDKSDDLNEAVTLKNAGIITVNEARAMVDLDPVKDGDVLVTQPTQDTQAPQKRYIPRIKKNVPSELKGVNIHKFLRRTKMFSKKELNHYLREQAKPLIQKMGKKKVAPKKEAEPQIHQSFTNERVMGYYEKQIRIVAGVEEHFHRALQKFIRKIEKQVMDNLDHELGQKKVKQLFDTESLEVEAMLDFRPILMQGATLAGKEALALIDREEPYLPFDLEASITKNVRKFTESMLKTDRESLTNIISSGVDAGNSVAEIRTLIADRFNEIEKYQAERITRTEVLRVSNMAAEDAWTQSGVVEGKQWLTAGATDECAQYEGQIVGLGGDFYSGGNEFQDGDPPLHPNCRCVILPVVEGAKSIVIDRKSSDLERIKELEAQIDKRTKAFRDLKKETSEKSASDEAYIKSLEALLK